MSIVTQPTVPIPAEPAVEHFGPAMMRFALAAIRRARAPRPDSPRFAMVLMPWYRQAAGWFNVALGLMLIRAGAQVEFLIDDLPYPAIHPRELYEVAAFDAFCRQFEAMFPMRRLSAFAGTPETSRQSALNALVADSLAVDIRHRSGAGTMDRNGADAFRRSARTPALHLAAACDRFLSQEQPDVLVAPGGVANGSYVMMRLAAEHGVRFASADSAFGALVTAAHGIAAHMMENAKTVAHLLALPAEVRVRARNAGAASLAEKVEAARTDATALPPCDLLLPLGYDWDTGALAMPSLYDTQREWVLDTLDHVGRAHPNVRMVLRQHPHEAANPCLENDELLAQVEAAGIANVTIMRAREGIPVYGLLTRARACVTCQSTVALEATALGMPAMAMRDTHYVAAGLIPRARTRDEYFAWLAARFAGSSPPVPAATRDAAATMYFVFDRCMTQATRFTPHASDLWSWLHQDPAADMMSTSLSDLVRSFVADVPLTTLTARRWLGLPAMPDGVPDPLA